MVTVLYTRFTQKLPAQTFEYLLQSLPLAMQSQVLKYRFWQDAHRSLLGKSLLIQALKVSGYSSVLLNNIEFTALNKPFLPKGPFFNISHSGDVVVCAISDTLNMGIDIEEVKEMPLADFTDLFSPEELSKIYKTQGDFIPFYTLWTQKEALVKAIGSGLNIYLKHVNVQGDYIYYNNDKWFLKPLHLHQGYICHLATSITNPPVLLNQIFF